MAQSKSGKKLKSRSKDNFLKNVFINCPFDDQYLELLRPLLFTILYLGYEPRIASERFDSGEARINKIQDLIKVSKFGIHDLSRLKSTRINQINRLNMSFELGLDIGCRMFSKDRKKNKKSLILEKEKYTYKKAISDLSNSDIKNHDNKPEKLVQQVRNWFVEVDKPDLLNATKIWEKFNEFMADFYQKRKEEGFKNRDLQIMPKPEFIFFIKKWLKNR